MIEIPLFHLASVAKTLPFECAQQSLTPDELTYLATITSESRRLEVLYGRYLLKRALARHLDCDTHSIQLLKNSGGKPYVAGHNLEFSLTHSEGYLAFAINTAGIVGLDIESKTRTHGFEAIAKRYFTCEEYQAICEAHNAEQQGLFYRIWTRKEAILKATGAGISAGLDRFNTLDIIDHQPFSLKLPNTPTEVLRLYSNNAPLNHEGLSLSIAYSSGSAREITITDDCSCY